jgi:hypothetical protein
LSAAHRPSWTRILQKQMQPAHVHRAKTKAKFRPRRIRTLYCCTDYRATSQGSQTAVNSTERTQFGLLKCPSHGLCARKTNPEKYGARMKTKTESSEHHGNSKSCRFDASGRASVCVTVNDDGSSSGKVKIPSNVNADWLISTEEGTTGGEGGRAASVRTRAWGRRCWSGSCT